MQRKHARPFVIATAATLSLALFFSIWQARRQSSTAPTHTASEQLAERYGQLPLHFEPNRGQAAAPVQFQARGDGYALFLTQKEAVLGVQSARCEVGQDTIPAAVRLRFANANPTPEISGQNELPGKVHYLRGYDPAQWRTDVPTYARVRYGELYAGVDAVFYGNQRRLEYDLIVQPGADPSVIALQFDGADKLELDEQGDLLLHTAGGTLRQHKPVVYQQLDNARHAIESHYTIRHPLSATRDQVGFALGDYDPALPLVIDPVLSYATYLGGAAFDNVRCGGDAATSIAVDGAGNAYVTGETRSFNDFPQVNPFQTQNNSGFSAFVTKLNAAGTGFVYSTYLCGVANPNQNTYTTDLAVDALGSAYVVGWTATTDFPTTAGAFIPSPRTGTNGAGFVTKLAPNGAALAYSTYLGEPVTGNLGGAGDGEVTTIAVDAAGNAYVAGKTRHPGFPTTAGAFQPTLGANVADSAFVTKLNAGGTQLVYSTFLGGSGANVNDQALSLAVDGGGNAFVTGRTNAANFPVTPGAFQTMFQGGFSDAFVTKLNATGTALLYSTYFGGAQREQGNSLAIDASGNAYLTGFTDFGANNNFPATPNAFRPHPGGDAQDAFLAKLNASGTALVYSTYLGFASDRTGNGVAVDASGNAYVAGNGTSTYIVNGVQTAQNDSWVLKMNAAGTGLVFSTPLGGNNEDFARAITLDGAGNAYITGNTQSGDFPVTLGAAQTTNLGGCFYGDAFIAKLSVQAGDCPAITINPQPLPTAVIGVPYSQTLTATGGTGPYNFDFFPGVPNFPPAGLSLAANGTLSGTPVGGPISFAFNVRATAANGCVGVRPYRLVYSTCPDVTVAPAALPNGTAGTAYNQTLSATGGVAPHSFTVTAGALPNGLALNAASGALTGTPTLAGNFNFTVTATDANGCTGTRAYAVTIVCPAVTVNPASLPNGTTGLFYDQTVSAVPAGGNYNFAVTAGALPNGLALNATSGALTGTPTAAGTFNFTITATGFGTCAGNRAYGITINCPAITVNPPTLPAGTRRVPYSQTLTATGGTPNYSFSLSAGALPNGLSLSAAGLLAGTPTQAGSFNFTVKATDANGCMGTRVYALVINRKRTPKADFDGDGKTDLSAWRGPGFPAVWLALQSSDGGPQNIGWGTGQAPYFDVPVPGDYDGDGLTDQAIWRGQDSLWYIRLSSTGQPFVRLWGANYAPYNDVPTPGDFDDDGKTDIAVWRPTDGVWYIIRSSDGSFLVEQWGATGDTPVAADYDGDGKTDIAVWRGQDTNWYIKKSSGGTQIISWGAGYAPYFDVPVPADYDGDGKADPAIWRGQDSLWYIRQSSNNQPFVRLWGANYAPYFDVPVPGDYDGDGKADIAVWRPADGNWYVIRSTTGTFLVQQHGQQGDTPVPSAGVR